MTGERRRYRLACFTKNRLNPAYNGARLGVDRLAAEVGVAVEHYVPDEPDSAPEQIALIDKALKRPPDAVVITPCHPTAINASLRKIQEAGIPLFFFNAKPAEIDGVTIARSDDEALAHGVAQFLLRRMGGRGRFLVLQGSPASLSSGPRDQGFLRALGECPGASVAAMASGDFLAEPARAVVARLIREGLAFDGIVAANDIMAVGALQALREGGRTPVPMVGINATPEGIAMVKKGEMLATASFDAMKLACIATLAALRHLRGETVPKDIVLPVEVVHAGNCAAWDVPYERRGLPRWEDVVAR